MRELLREVRIDEVRVVGGGGRSKIWNQIKADVLGTPYILLNREEYAVTALAVIGGYGVKKFKNYIKTINEWVKPIKKIQPNMEVHKIYQRYSNFYEKLIEHIDYVYVKK